MHVDLLSTALYLKILTAEAGGYTVPRKAKGGIARYNNGGVKNYLGKVKNHAPSTIPSNLTCVEDTYTPEVADHACALELPGEDYDSCMDEFEYDFFPTDSVEI